MTGIDVEAARVHRRAHRARRRRVRDRRERGRDVRGRDRPAGRRADPDRADGARVRRDPAVPRPRRAHRRRCATPTTSSTSARRAAGWCGAATSGRAPRGRCATTAAGSTTSRPTSTAACWRRTGTASRRSSATRGCACRRSRTSRVTRLINGPEAFTPDGEFCLGETEVRGLFVAAGFCAHGLAGAGGIGKVMAEWIAGGEPELDLWAMDVRRFGAHYRSPALHAQARARGLRDLLRHQVPQPRAGGRAGRCASRRPTTGTASTAPCSARSRAGSA